MLQIRDLPSVIESDNAPEKTVSKTPGSDKMQIAFRYQNLPVRDTTLISNKHIGHYYDLSKSMSLSDIENADISYWTGQRIEHGKSRVTSTLTIFIKDYI